MKLFELKIMNYELKITHSRLTSFLFKKLGAIGKFFILNFSFLIFLAFQY